MCGIAGFVIKRPDDKRPLDREKLLDELLYQIDLRGGDATGFVARSPGGMIEWHKASCDAPRFVPRRRGMPLGANVALAHTRYATQGHQAFPENNHPIRRGAMYVIHNGVITNDRELFTQCDRERFGDVDSEAIAAVLSHTGSLAESDALKTALGTIEGSAAIAAMDERTGEVLLARLSGSPLVILETRRVLIFASTESAVTRAHTAAIGSLGRSRAEVIGEGCAIAIKDGELSRFSFVPAPSPVRTWVPTPATSASYVLGDGSAPKQVTGKYGSGRTFGDRWEWQDDSLVDTGSATPNPSPAPRPLGYLPAAIESLDCDCELCGERTSDPYDYFDGWDDWTLCESCHSFAQETAREGSALDNR